MRAILLAVPAAAVLAACTVGPDYRRPEAELPASLGAPAAAPALAADWWKLFQDPVLDRLEEEALAANRDLRIAAERIEQARAQVAIARSDIWPSVGVELERSRNRASQLTGVPLPADQIETNTHRAVVRASWELDFWGKYRRATEAARAQLTATEAGRDSVRATLAADVARGYFNLRALDRRLEVAERTLAGYVKAFDLQKLRLEGGVVSELEYRQVEGAFRASEALVPVIRQDIVRQEGALALLVGRSPRAVFEARVERGYYTATPEVEVPAGLPSELLLRRPDLRQAEAQLQAANARIGVARAAYFPSITLTGFFGGESQALTDLFTAQARTFNVAAGVLQPLWESGAIKGGVDLADAQTREAAERYQAAIANAFREVRDAIASQGNAREALAAQVFRESALSRTLDLTRLRYDNGTVSLFEVLETERILLNARLEAIDAERNRRGAIVDLYLALGA